MQHGAAEHVGVLPDRVERDDAAERGAPHRAVPAMPAYTNAAALDLGHDLLDQRPGVRSYPGFVYSVIRSPE